MSARTQPAAPQNKALRVTVTAAERDGEPPRVIAVTNPDKVLYPEEGFTKADVVAYYRKVAPRLLPFLIHEPTGGVPYSDVR